jgi:homoserine O-acetyltransferase
MMVSASRATGALGRLAALAFLLVAGPLWAEPQAATDYPAPVEGDAILRDFRFNSGEVLPELRIHYRVLGTPRRDRDGVVRNAVMVLHGTGGDGGAFLRSARGGDEFGGELFGPGKPLDVSRYFVILPDGIGHGRSSKPSDGLKGRFPRYGYLDMIEAQRRLLVEELGVNHLHLLIGTSMGGMHAWLWGQLHPDFTDGLVPLASLPVQIAGRNRMWRKIVIDAIRSDPGWNGGDSQSPPPGLRAAVQVLYFMSGSPRLRQAEAPTLAAADERLARTTDIMARFIDANDLLYAVEASHDYDPAPGLGRIRAPLLAINFADDLINPPELGILEREIARVPRGRAVLVPEGPETIGHGTHTRAAVWKHHLVEFMRGL